MPGPQRRIDPGVAHKLFAEPYRFEFFQAMRVLEHLFVRLGTRADNVLARKLRFRNSLNMAFPASEIEKLVGYNAADEALTATADGEAPDWDKLDEVDITPAFMGMLGSQGVLPFAYTEIIGQRELIHRDHAARAFLDIFYNRAVALFYKAWKKYRLAYQYELDRSERFLPLVLSLAGMGLPSQRERLRNDAGAAVYDQGIAYYAAAVAQRPVSATFMQRMLSEYLRADIRIEQFAGAWYPVPAGEQTTLGGSNASLGVNVLSGQRVWQRDLRLRLWVGPLRRAQYHDFLPGGKAATALAKWLTLLGGDALEYEVRLILHRDDVRPSGLASTDEVRLGFDTFVATRAPEGHRADASYLLHTLN